MPAPHPAKAGRFHSLDVLRGVAALSVVLYHYVHFFHEGPDLSADFVAERDLPLYRLLRLIYMHGWLGVDLFFALSGFVFFWLYLAPIGTGTIRPLRFAALRFSRLYPLHFATLLLVAGLQWQRVTTEGTPFVYVANDWSHFVAHLFFASNWLPGQGYSFNAPVWSVSVEVVLYALFFVFAKALGSRRACVTFATAGMLVIGYAGVRLVNPELSRGIVGFFTGGAVFLAYSWVSNSGNLRLVAPCLTAVALALWLLSFAASLAPGTGLSTDSAVRAFARGVLFPLTILALALAETNRGTVGRQASWLGDISYASYLLHFPLQLLVVLVLSWAKLDRHLLSSPAALIGFFAVLIPLSIVVHRHFERPLQSVVRSRFGAHGVA